MKGVKYVIVVDTDANNSNVQLQFGNAEGFVEYVNSLKGAAEQLGVELSVKIARETGGARRL